MLERVRRPTGWLGKLSQPLRRLAIASITLWIAAGAAAMLTPILRSETNPKKTPTPSVVPNDPSAEAPARDSALPMTPTVATQASEVNTADDVALRRVIDLYWANREYAQAAPFVDQAWAAGWRDTSFLAHAAEIYLDNAEYAKAAAAAAQGLQQDSGSLPFWRVAGMSAFRLGHYADGMQLDSTALKRFPDQMDLLVDRGTMEVEMGPGHPGYGRSLQRALQLDSNWLPALYLLGRKHSLEGNFGDAERVFRRVTQRDSNYAKAWAQLGIALYQQGKMEAAGPCMIQALKENPRDYNSWYNLGEWYSRKMDQTSDADSVRVLREKAMQCYLHTVELNPDQVQAQFRIGVLLHGNGQFKEAIRHFEAAVRVDSTDAAAWFQMGVAYQRLAQREKARACVEHAFQLQPLNPVIIAKLRELS